MIPGLTARESNIVHAGVKIASQAPSSQDIAYQHAVLCQLGLPRKKVPGPEFMRISGQAWVSVNAGYLDRGDGPELQLIPYGPLPRLALAWVSTYARRKKSRVVPIGDTANEFLRMLHMDDGGHRYNALRVQMNGLAACRIQLGYKGRTINSQPVKRFDAWLATKCQRALWPGELELSEDYYQALCEHSVPLDKRALLALRGSALELDIYTWLAHRLRRIESASVNIWWTPLREQFGAEYRSLRDFKYQFRIALNRVLAVYPAAVGSVDVITGGLKLRPALPPVPETRLRVARGISR